MEKGLKNLQNAKRHSTRSTANGDADYDRVLESSYTLQHQVRQVRAKSHQDDGDDFNDSAIGPDADHSLVGGYPSEHQRSYASSLHNEPAPYSAGTTTPPYSSTGRTFSTSSSSVMTPSLATSTGFQYVQHPSPHQQPSQTLPSFNSAFGMQSLGNVVTRPSPTYHNAVTTQ